MRISDAVEICRKSQKIRMRHNSGMPMLDMLIGGLESGKVYLIGGGEMMGKTGLALTLTKNLLDEGVKVGFFADRSCQDVDFMVRVVSILRGGKCPATYEEREKLLSDAQMEDVGLYLECEPWMKWSYFVGRCRYLVEHEGVGCLIWDTMEDMFDPDGSIGNGQGVLGRYVKRLAEELNVCIIVTTQDGRYDKSQEPTIEDLSDWSGMSHYSDCVMEVTRPEMLGIKYDEMGSTTNKAVIYVLKSGYRTGKLSVPIEESSGMFAPEI